MRLDFAVLGSLKVSSFFVSSSDWRTARHGCVEIEVPPSKRQDLAAAKSSCQSEQDRHPEKLVSIGCPEEGFDLGIVERPHLDARRPRRLDRIGGIHSQDLPLHGLLQRFPQNSMMVKDGALR